MFDGVFLQTTPFNVISDKCISLGLVVTNKLNQMLNHNCERKMEQLERNTEFANILPISAVARINVVTLRGFIFSSSKHSLRRLNSVFSYFIWLGRIPITSRKHLNKGSREVCFRHTQCNLCYPVAHLNILSLWCCSVPGTNLEE